MGVLRLREFRLLFGAQAISWFGDRMVTIALAFAVLELGGSASEVGLVLAFRMVPLVATLLAGGVVADRLSRRAVMVAADLVRVLTQGNDRAAAHHRPRRHLGARAALGRNRRGDR